MQIAVPKFWHLHLPCALYNYIFYTYIVCKYARVSVNGLSLQKEKKTPIPHLSTLLFINNPYIFHPHLIFFSFFSLLFSSHSLLVFQKPFLPIYFLFASTTTHLCFFGFSCFGWLWWLLWLFFSFQVCLRQFFLGDQGANIT